MQKFRCFLDANIFIYAFELRDSNSYLVIDLLNKGKIEAVVSERVLKEVIHYFRKFYDRSLSNGLRNYILQSCTIIFKEEVKEMVKKLKGKIKEKPSEFCAVGVTPRFMKNSLYNWSRIFQKDLEQIATVKALGLRYLISYDKDFKKFEEYITQKYL